MTGQDLRVLRQANNIGRGHFLSLIPAVSGRIASRNHLRDIERGRKRLPDWLARAARTAIETASHRSD